MTMKLPPAWASNTNYSTGPDNGTPTKVDPASQADGFIRGVGAAAQHVNFVLEPLTSATRGAFAIAALRMRELVEGGVTITDTAESMGAIQRNVNAPVLAAKTAQAFAVTSTSRFSAIGVPASITSLVTDAATNGTRIVVIGTGGNRCSYTDDDGESWSAGGNIGATPTYIVRNSTYGNYIVAVGSAVKYSTNAAAWTAPSSSCDTPAGLAVLSNGDTVVVSTVGGQLSKSTDGGVTWGANYNPLANVGSFDETGTLAGFEGSFIYHVARLSGGTSLQVSASADGTTWTVVKTFSPPIGCTFNSRPRIMCCQRTGLIAIVAPRTADLGTVFIDSIYASLDGTDWVGPAIVKPSPGIAAYALAGGRLFSTFNAQMMASDGVIP